MTIPKRKRVSSDATDRKASAMRYQVVRVHDGRVLAGSPDKLRAETTAEVLGPGYVVRERQAQS